jgi:hypothetical protein
VKIGYFLASEEWGPRDLVAQDALFAAYRDQVLPRVR